jgi:hypothetical protein
MTTTLLASSPNPSAHSNPVTFAAKDTAALGGTPSGTVTFERWDHHLRHRDN